MLKINGKCAVVLPDGQDLFSKTNKTLVAIREYLMKTCDLKEIIYLPSGVFTYTSIKTCVMYFIKKAEGKDVLETKIKISKVQKELGRDYKFSKTHQTTIVKFSEYIDENNKLPSTLDENKEIKALGDWISHQKTNYKIRKHSMKDDIIYNKFKNFLETYEIKLNY